MKLSTYNIEIPINNNELVVYNTLTGSVIKLPKNSYNIENADLIKYKFVVSKSIDEINLYKFRYFAAIYAFQSLHITIAPTMQCNFCCPYCFEGSNKGGNIMSTEVINSIQNFLRTKSDKSIAITWFGGEPFLGWKAIDTISSFLISENINFHATAITNGSICTKEIISNLDKYKIKRLQITLDGDRKIHDSKRVFKNGDPSFDLLIRNIHTFLEQTKVKVVIRINIDKTNLSCYSRLCTVLDSEFRDYIINKRVILSPNPIKNRTQFEGCSNCLSIDEYFEFERAGTPSLKRFPTQVGPCSLRCRSSIGIGPDGNIYKCLEHFGEPSKAIGSILDASINLQKEAQYAVGILPFDLEPCSSCKLLPICGGGCAIDLKNFEKEGVGPSCIINTQILKEQILNYYELDSQIID